MNLGDVRALIPSRKDLHQIHNAYITGGSAFTGLCVFNVQLSNGGFTKPPLPDEENLNCYYASNKYITRIHFFNIFYNSRPIDVFTSLRSDLTCMQITIYQMIFILYKRMPVYYFILLTWQRFISQLSYGGLCNIQLRDTPFIYDTYLNYMHCYLQFHGKTTVYSKFCVPDGYRVLKFMFPVSANNTFGYLLIQKWQKINISITLTWPISVHGLVWQSLKSWPSGPGGVRLLLVVGVGS